LIEHVVLFRWKADAAPDAIAHAIAGLRDLKGQVPSVMDLSCGENFSDRAQGYQCGLVVRVADRAALDGYMAHPLHRAVVEERINPIRDGVLAVDYEF
jgi:hypothetical protein